MLDESIKIINKYTFEIDFKEELVVVTFKMKKKHVEKLDKISKAVGLSRSEIIRFAIFKLLEKYKDIKDLKKEIYKYLLENNTQ